MELGDLFKQLVWDNLVKAALGKLFAAIPFLGWGPIGYVLSWAATHFADKLYELAKMTVQLEAIVLLNEAHRKAFDTASLKLKVVAIESGTSSEQFRKARDEAKAALSQFVRFAA